MLGSLVTSIMATYLELLFGLTSSSEEMAGVVRRDLLTLSRVGDSKPSS